MKVNQKLMLGLFGILATIGIAGSILYARLTSIKLSINQYDLEKYQEDSQGDINDEMSNSLTILALALPRYPEATSSPTEVKKLRSSIIAFQQAQKKYLGTLNKYLIIDSSDLFDSSDFATDLRNQIKSISILATETNALLSDIVTDLENQALVKLRSDETVLIQKLNAFNEEVLRTQEIVEENQKEEFTSIQKTLDVFHKEVNSFQG